MTTEHRSSEKRLWATTRGRWIIASILAGAGLIAILTVLTIAGPRTATPGSPASPGDDPAVSASPTPSAAVKPSATPAPTPAATVSPDGRAVTPPVALDSPAVVVTGLTATVVSLEAVDGEARAPGDVAGPSVRVTITLINATSDAIDLTTARTNMYFGAAATPAAELPGPGVAPLPASVAAGETVTTIAVFSVPTTERDDVTIQFDYSVDVPIVAFRGAAPR